MSRKFFIFTIGGFGIAVLLFFVVIGGFAFHPGSSPTSNFQLPTSNFLPPGPPPPPSLSLTIRKLKTGNSLIVRWINLPRDTAALDLFCSSLLKPTASSSWTLWKEILLSSGELAAGNREVQLGIWYRRCSFYVVQAITAPAVGSLKVGATTTLETRGEGLGIGEGEAILWTSAITTPSITTSTAGLPPMTPPNTPPNSNPTGTTDNKPNNNSSTAQNSSSPPPTSSAPAPSSSPPAPSASGTPYYNPQVQVVAYAASGSPIFWVQHANQGIEIGWQNIPPDTDTIVILRSANQSGPWTAFLTEKNLPTDQYSLQIVDSSLEIPYYYEMQAVAGSSTVATYGPDYLAPVNQ